MRRAILLSLAIMAISACSHKEKTDPATLPFRQDLVVNRPVLLKNGYGEEGTVVYEAFRKSGYFPQLYREDDIKTDTDNYLILDAKLEKDGTSNGLQEANVALTIATLGIVPATTDSRYTLNVGAWWGKKFIDRYKASRDDRNVYVAYNSFRADEESLILQMLPEVLTQMKPKLN